MLSMLREPLPICAPVLPLNLVGSLECSMAFFCTLSLLYRIILASIQDCKDEMNSIKGLVLYHLAQRACCGFFCLGGQVVTVLVE